MHRKVLIWGMGALLGLGFGMEGCGGPNTGRVFGGEGGTDSTSSSTSSSSGMASSSSSGGVGASMGSGGAGGGAGGGGTGDPCVDTVPLSGGCAPSGAECNKVLSRCIALEDTCTSVKPLFRIGQLSIGKPAVFSGGAVGNLLSDAAMMNLPQCNLDGIGAFSWLIQFNLATNTFETGGAEPAADPFAGYCFTKQKSFSGAVNPIMVDPQGGMATVDENNKATFSEISKINIAAYLDGGGTNAIVLPISQLRFNSVSLSADHRCIGEYNSNTLKPGDNCLPGQGQSAFSNNGSMDGYIVLEEADNVIVEPLGQSLCVLISGNPAMYGNGASPNRCARDANGKITFQGDWCQGTNQPAGAGCADASRFVANFAASAVKASAACP